MNPVHYKSLTYKLEFIPFFTTTRLLTSLFFKAFPLDKACDCGYFSWFVRARVHLNMNESLKRNLILALPVIGQIIIIADEILMRISPSYLIYRSDWSSALATLSEPIPSHFRNNPEVARAALRLNLDWTTGINLGEDLRKNKEFFLDLLNNPVSAEYFSFTKGFDKRTAIVGAAIYQVSYSKKYKETLSDELRFSLSYIKELNKLLKLMDPSLKKDRELMEKFLDVSPFLFQWIDDELKKDPNILKFAEMRFREIFNIAYGRSSSETMKWYAPYQNSTEFKIHRVGMAPDEFKALENEIANENLKKRTQIVMGQELIV